MAACVSVPWFIRLIISHHVLHWHGHNRSMSNISLVSDADFLFGRRFWRNRCCQKSHVSPTSSSCLFHLSSWLTMWFSLGIWRPLSCPSEESLTKSANPSVRSHQQFLGSSLTKKKKKLNTWLPWTANFRNNCINVCRSVSDVGQSERWKGTSPLWVAKLV